MDVPLRILLIDDHPGSLIVLRHALRCHGHACEAVQSVEKALALIPLFHPQVILYEWYLRGGCGVGLARRLRAQCTAHEAPSAIVALSTLNEPEGFVEREGVDGYVSKPLCPDQLDALLASVGVQLSRAGESA
jgi:CheY-like chemotaxis protein